MNVQTLKTGSTDKAGAKGITGQAGTTGFMGYKVESGVVGTPGATGNAVDNGQKLMSESLVLWDQLDLQGKLVREVSPDKEATQVLLDKLIRLVPQN